ncbi:MAG: TetR family transcriptional regulator C-terminal domain-containing protein [Desulfovibrionaceae bacterium]
MTDTTRERIIMAGAELIHARGFNNTGIKEIVETAGVPKGSFYFYFSSKEAFGLAVVDQYEATFLERLHALATETSLSPLDRLRAFFERTQQRFASQGYSRGCPLGNLAQEMGDLSPAFQERLERAMRHLTRILADLLQQAVDAGELDTAELGPHPLEEIAFFIVEAWHGALVRMKSAKSGEPLDICRRMIFERVLRRPL